MNVIVAFATELVLTVAASFLLMRYLGPSLFRILVDLCATEERARFWLSFSKLLLVGAPVTAALAFRPRAGAAMLMFFDLMKQLSRGLLSFLLALVVLGIVLSVFAAIARLAPEGRSA